MILRYCPLFVLCTLIGLAISSNSPGASPLDGLLKELQQNLPSDEIGISSKPAENEILALFHKSHGASDKSPLKSLFKGLQQKQPSGGKAASGRKAEIDEGAVDYSASSIVDFLCKAEPLPGLPDDPSPDVQLVADDFGKSIKETRKVLRRNFTKPIGPKWAQSLPYYKDAFDQTEAKLLFNAFLESRGDNLEVLSQLQQMSKSESTSTNEQQEYGDAKFAYGIVLMHYQDFHKKKTYAEDLIDDAAWNDDQVGAVYLTGKRLYYGWGIPKDINKAGNFAQTAHQKEKFERATQLWMKVALDPAYKYHKRYAQMAERAKQIEADLKKEANKKTGSALRRRIDRLNNLRITALKKLADAFGVADKLATILSELEDLRNQADPSQASIEKNAAIGNEANKFMLGVLKKGEKLDPEGQKLAQEASNMTRTVIAQLGATTSQFMSNPGATSSLMSDMLALAPAMDKGMNAACKLNSGIAEYAKAKKVTIEQGDIKADEEDEFKEEPA